MSPLESAPATKADVLSVKSELSGEIAAARSELKSEIATVKSELKSEIGDVKSELKSDIAAVKSELKSDIAALRTEVKSDLAASTKRLAHEIVKTNARVDRLGDDLRGEMRALRGDVAKTMDAAVSRMEILWRESALLPHVIDDHGRRISALEARASR